MDKIPFNKPLVTGNEEKYINQVLSGKKFCGDGPFTFKCQKWLQKHLHVSKALLTTSCTHALEMAALLIDVKRGDEIIMPSYTFVSTANAFVLRGAKIVFVDIKPDSMNIDEDKIEAAITDRTKAIVPVHYAGVACNMDAIMDLAERHNLYVIEDAAQGILASYKEKPLGSIGHLGTLSFHETKNIHCGEGGALLINDKQFIERAEIIREKGTNRKKFLRGEVDKYTWVDIGSSYLPDELNAAFLYAQFEQVQEITDRRVRIYNWYHEKLSPLVAKGLIDVPRVPGAACHNGHMFYIKLRDFDQRELLIEHLKAEGIGAVFHYIPLHSSKVGQTCGTMKQDTYTTTESNRLLRLPMYYDLSITDIKNIVQNINTFFSC